jgi:WD40 repeat protein
LVSDLEPQVDTTIENMAQFAVLKDSQPIRAACFSPSGDYFVLGTNSKALKICQLPNLEGGPNQPIRVVLEQLNHHIGSIYCVDWSRTERLIASGSNDRHIKLLVVPNL